MRNYRGEKLQQEFIQQALRDCMEHERGEHDPQFEESWNNDIWIFVSQMFKCEQKGRKLNVSNLAHYIDGRGLYMLPFERGELLDLRDKWGYKTKEELWMDGWSNHVASYIIRELQKRNLI